MGEQQKREIILSYLVFAKYNIEQMQIVWQVIKIINGIFLICIRLEDIFLQFFDSHEVDQKIDIVYWYISNQYQCVEIIFYVCCCFWIVFVGCLGIYYYMEIKLASQKKLNKFTQFVIYFPIFMIMLMELCYSFITYLIIEFFYKFTQYSTLTGLLVIICLIFLLLTSVLNYQNRIFSICQFLVVGIMVITTTQISIVLLIILCVIMIQNDNNKVSRSIYACFIVAQIFQFIELFDDTDGLQQNFMLVMSMVFSVVIIVNRSMFGKRIGSNAENNRFLVQFLDTHNKQKAKSVFEMARYIVVQSILRQFVNSYRNEMDRTMVIKLIKQPIKYCTFPQLIEMLDIKLTIDYLKQKKNYQIIYIYFYFRMKHLYKINHTLKLISEYLEDSKYREKKNKQSVSYRELYVKKNIELMISRQFMNKQLGNQKVYHFIELSKIQYQFLSQSMEVLCKIYLFWEQIGMNVLVEEQIFNNFYSILKKIKKLKQYLRILKSGYRATRQIMVMSTIIKLIEPYFINKDVSINNSYISDYKEETLIFFVQHNKKIVRASPCFLKYINYTYEQIIHQPTKYLIPEQIIQRIEQRQYQEIKDIKQLKVNNIIPIICSNSAIKICQINIKLETESNLGVHFFYFIKKIQNQSQFAYLYLNAVDLQIKYASQQFFTLFNLNQQQIVQKFNTHQIFLNTLLTNYNPNEIISDLINKKIIKCNFNTQSLINKKNHHKNNFNYKYQGFINLVVNYQSNLLVYINITEDQFGPTAQPQTIPSIKQCFPQKHQQFSHLYQGQKNSSEQLSFLIQSLCKQQIKKQQNSLQNTPIIKKILDKQSQINSQTKNNCITYSNCIKIIMLIIIIIVIVMPTILIVFWQQQSSMVQDIISNIEKSVDHSNLLAQATFEVFVQYVISNNSQFFQQFLANNSYNTNNITVNQLLEFQYTRIHNFIREFNYQFTTFFSRTSLPNPYTLIYSNFTISTDFSKTNLISYAFKTKLTSQKVRIQYQTSILKNQSFLLSQQVLNPLNFLLLNYPILVNLYAPFDSVDVLNRQYINMSQKLKILTISLGSACIFLIIITVYLIKNKLQIIYDTLQIFTLANRQEIQQRMNRIKQVLKKFLDEIPLDNIKKLIKFNIIENKTLSLYKVHIKNNFQFYTEKSVSDQFYDDREDKKVIKLRFNGVVSGGMYVVGLGILMTVLFGMLGFFIYQIDQNISITNIVFNYYNQINWIKHKELKESCDMIHHKLAYQILNVTTQTSPLIPNKQSSVNKQLSNKYQKIFAEYFTKQNILLSQTLCSQNPSQQHKTKQTLLGLINCNKIGLGIMKEGFTQTLQYFDLTILDLINGNSTLLEIDSKSQYPNIIAHISMRQEIMKRLAEIQQLLLTQKDEITSHNNTKILTICIICYITSLIIIIYIIIKMVPQIIKIKQVCIGYFKSFNRQMLISNRVSHYLEQKNMLDRIGYL